MQQMSLAGIDQLSDCQFGVLHVQINVSICRNLHKTVSHTIYQMVGQKNKAIVVNFPQCLHQPTFSTSCLYGPSIIDALPLGPITDHTLSWLQNRLATSESQ